MLETSTRKALTSWLSESNHPELEQQATKKQKQSENSFVLSIVAVIIGVALLLGSFWAEQSGNIGNTGIALIAFGAVLFLMGGGCISALDRTLHDEAAELQLEAARMKAALQGKIALEAASRYQVSSFDINGIPLTTEMKYTTDAEKDGKEIRIQISFPSIHHPITVQQISTEIRELA